MLKNPSILRDVSLKKYNTFGLESKASILATITSIGDLVHVFSNSNLSHRRKFVVGSGSNTLFLNDFDGVILAMRIMGKKIYQDDDNWFITAAAGEDWSDFVQWTIERGFGGLENLSCIPGTVGACPVQNVGAYGVEVANLISTVSVFNTKTMYVEQMHADDCNFSYRDSIFKKNSSAHLVIVEVTFKLPKKWVPVLSYSELSKASLSNDIRTKTPSGISAIVAEIRRDKLPSPLVIGNAGSFFKNPILDKTTANTIIETHPEIPHYRQEDESIKFAAGWLIEKSGWKGRRIGSVGVYERQALVIVNHGGALGSDVTSLANLIKNDVFSKYGVMLETEPVMLN